MNFGCDLNMLGLGLGHNSLGHVHLLLTSNDTGPVSM